MGKRLARNRARLTAALLIGSLLIAVNAWASHGTVKGRVRDGQGQPLSGVNILLVGSKLGATTDAGGRYAIYKVPFATYRIRASMIGYMSATRRNVVVGGQVEVDFTLREQPIELSSTIIAASPIGEEVKKAPNRVNIVDREEIEQTPAFNIQEVLQNVEGLYVPRGEGLNMTFPRIVMRGMNTGFLGRNTGALVLLNGHSINGTLGSWGNVADLDALPLDIVQKTEVIKGPYTSTYGSGATGGVINILTQKHFAAPVGGSVTARTGAYGFRSLAPVVHGQRGKLSYAAWGEFLHGEERETRRRVASGPQYSDWDDAESGYMDEGLVRHAKYGFMLGYDIDDGERIDVLGNYLERTNKRVGRPIGREEIAGRFLHVTFNRPINDKVDLQVLGNYLDTDYDAYADAMPAHPDSADRVTRFQQWPNRDLGFKVLLSGRLRDGNDLIAGVEWRRSESGRTSYYGNRDTLEFDISGIQDIYSFFVEEKIHLGRLELTPGLRLEQWKDDALYSEQQPDENSRNVHVGYSGGRADRTAFNPKIGAAFLLSDRLKLRIAAGSTFRAPRITETYSPNYQTLSFLKYRANLDLKEERIVSYEAGFDFRTANQRFFLSLTGFLVDARDRIDFTFVGGFTDEDPFIIEHKNLDAEIPGVEGEMGLWLMDGLLVGGNFSVVSPNYKDGPAGFGDNVTEGVPDHTVNAHIDYEPVDGLDLRLSAQRIGRIYDDPKNEIELDPYILFNLKGRYELPLGATDSCFLDASLTNLLDEDYQIPSNVVHDYKPMGRALYVALGYRF